MILSYEKFMEITDKLTPEEQEYVLKFLLASEAKRKRRIKYLEEEEKALRQEKNRYNNKTCQLSEKIKSLNKREDKVKGQVATLAERIRQLERALEKRKEAFHDLNFLIRRLHTEVDILTDPNYRISLLTACEKLASVEL